MKKQTKNQIVDGDETFEKAMKDEKAELDEKNAELEQKLAKAEDDLGKLDSEKKAKGKAEKSLEKELDQFVMVQRMGGKCPVYGVRAEGDFVVYQKLLAFNGIEPATAASNLPDKFKHFVIPENMDNKIELLCELLENISKKLFDIVGRNETVKTLLKSIKELRPKYPFLQLLNVDYSGEVSLFNWKKDLDMETVHGFAELTFQFISEVNLMFLDEETGVQLEQLVERMDARLEEINFYQVSA